MSEESTEVSPTIKEKEEEMNEDSEVEADKSKDDDEEMDTSKEEEKKTPKKEKADKTPKKEKKEKDEDKEEEEEDSEEEDDEESPKVGILEMPVVLEKGAKRERKKVERLEFQSPTEAKFEVTEGKGCALGDIPFIEFKITRTKAEDLKPLHRVLFRKPGSNADCKKNIRKFSGFPFSKDDDEYKKRHDILSQLKFKMSMVKNICEVLDIKRQGTKEEVVTRLLDFLMKPSDSGRKVPKPKRQSKGKGEKSGKKQKKEKKAKSKSKTESDDEEDDDEEEEEEEEEDEEEEEEEESDEEEKPPKKKAKKEPKKKVEKKKETKKKEVKEKPKKKESKPQKKTTPKKKKEEVSDISDISDSDEDSDDEPLIKKSGPPTNDELKDLIKKMLDSANLEEVTMKTVLKDVYAKYPNFDLSDRKDFIKNTVKQIIS